MGKKEREKSKNRTIEAIIHRHKHLFTTDDPFSDFRKLDGNIMFNLQASKGAEWSEKHNK